MKNHILAALVILTVAICTTSSATAQAYKPDWTTKVVLAGGGTDIVNTVTLSAPTQALGNIPLILPATIGTAGQVMTWGIGGQMTWSKVGIGSIAPSGVNNQFLTTDNTGAVNWQTLQINATNLSGNGLNTPLNVVTGNITSTTPAISIGGTGKTVASDITVNLTTGSLTSPTSSISLVGTGLLVGSGITADLNLGHANVWTNTQTFPVTAAQGDAIVNSINASTQLVGIAHGGTGQSTAIGAFNALSPMTTVGDIEYEAAGPTAARLGIGSTGQVLTVVGGVPSWQPSGGTITLSPKNVNVIGGPNTNDYAINGNNSVYYLQNSTGGSVNLTGLAGGTADRVIVLVNNSALAADAIVLTNEDALSTVGNRFHLQGASSIILGQDGTATLVYDSQLDGGAGAWRVIAAQ